MQHRLVNDELIVTLPESLSEKNASQTKDEFDHIMQNNTFGKMTIDCQGLTYISSSGLRVLLSVQKKLPKGETVKLTNVNSDVNQILEMTGFDDIEKLNEKEE